METVDYDIRLHESNKGDESLFVLFYSGTLKNEAKSHEAGRAIFDDVPYVKIFVPGDRNNIIERPAYIADTKDRIAMRDPRYDNVRFPKQWALFLQGLEQSSSGTPLEQWPLITRGQAETLKYMGFLTVEQIALASDESCSKMAGLLDLKHKASGFIELAKGSAPIDQLVEKNKELEAQLQAALGGIDALKKQVAEIHAEKSAAKSAK